MSTIALNTDETIGNEGVDKKKDEKIDKAKAAMAAGISGMAAGATIKGVVDSLEEKTVEDTTDLPEKQETHSSQTTTPSGQSESAVVDVNPDEVMLEDPSEAIEDVTVAEEIQENDIIVDYHPFASNDMVEVDNFDLVYSDEPIPEEYPEINEDLLIDDNPVDLICGTSDLIDNSSDGPCYLPDDSYAFDSDFLDDHSDIQSDLMA